MGWWSRFSAEKLAAAEERLLELSGVPVRSKHVKITKGLQMFSLQVGDPSKPLMLIIHGYCGAGLIFYKTFQALSQEYFVVTVDLLGMGKSSRPEVDFSSRIETEAFFVDSLELFRQAEGFERFVLVGHSFGGYISGCYASRYPQYIEKLLFLSAVGIPEAPHKFDFITSLQEQPWMSRWSAKFVMFFWVKHITPMELLRKAGPIAALGMKALCKFDSKYLSVEEAEAVTTYLQQLCLLPGSGEFGLSFILQPGVWAYAPLCRRLQGLNIPMAFFYGDRDWMPSRGVDRIQKTNEAPVIMKVLEDSGHHFYFDNPDLLVREMLQTLRDFEYPTSPG